MGKRGPKPAPTAIKILKNTQPCRINLESPIVNPALPEPPDFVVADESGFALRLWQELGPTLADIGVLTNLDRYAFGLVCHAYSEFMLNPTARNREDFRRLLAEHGLTPSSRSVLKAGQPSQVKDELEAFLAG